MQPRVSLITLGVADLQRSRRFYVEGLGLPVRDVGSDEVVFLQMGNLILGLWDAGSLAEDAGVPPQGSGFRSFALAHNVATRQEVDAVLREAVEAGGALVRPGHDAVWGGYTGFFADPDGFLWEVAWNPGMPDLAQ